MQRKRVCKKEKKKKGHVEPRVSFLASVTRSRGSGGLNSNVAWRFRTGIRSGYFVRMRCASA